LKRFHLNETMSIRGTAEEGPITTKEEKVDLPNEGRDLKFYKEERKN